MGVCSAMVCVCSAMLDSKVELIFSSIAILVEEYGELLWLIIWLLICRLTGSWFECCCFAREESQIQLMQALSWCSSLSPLASNKRFVAWLNS
jgi:hypothetical protein